MHENLQKETSQKDVKHPIVSNSMLQDTSSLEFLHGFGIIGRTAWRRPVSHHVALPTAGGRQWHLAPWTFARAEDALATFGSRRLAIEIVGRSQIPMELRNPKVLNLQL